MPGRARRGGRACRTRTRRSATRSIGDVRRAAVGRPAALLLIGHMDTVFDPGTAAERPFTIDDGIATRPGRHRHESGPAGRALRARGAARRASASCRSSGSCSSPTLTRRSARRRRRRTSASCAADADVCLVLECARANGDIVSSRKGILDLRLTVQRPRGACRRRAREGPQRDPRGGATSSRASTRSTAAGRA